MGEATRHICRKTGNKNYVNHPFDNQPGSNPPPPKPVVVAATETGSAASPAPVGQISGAQTQQQAELLMGYAAEVGIKVEGQVRDDVLKARAASDSGGVTGTDRSQSAHQH